MESREDDTAGGLSQQPQQQAASDGPIPPLSKDDQAKAPLADAASDVPAAATTADASPALSARRGSGSSAAVTPMRPPRSISSIYRTLAMAHTEAPAATPANGTAGTPAGQARAKNGAQPPLLPALGGRVSAERSDGLLALDAEHDKSDSGGSSGVLSKSHPTPSAKFVRQLQLSTTNAQIDAMAKDRSAREAAAAAAASVSISAEAARSDSAAPSSDSSSAPPSAEPLRHALSQSDAVAEVLDWSGKGLRAAGVEGGWSLYPSIHTLILRDNELTTLLKQGIDQLPNLHTLDLRRNRLSGFGDTLLVLSQCRALKHVYLHQSTRDNVTNNVSLYTDFVFQSLRGLESCDGVQSKLTIALNPLDQSAFDFIHMLSGMSENALLRCDLSNKKLPANLFFFLLSALHQLKIAWLKLDGDNEWASLNSYTNCVIYYLGKYLLYLDEEEITNQRLHLALKAQAESKIKIIKISWAECWDEALEVGREYVERLEIEREEMEEKERIWRHMRALEAGEDTSEFGNGGESQDQTAGGVGAATATAAAVAQLEAKRRQSQLDGDFIPLTAAEQQILDDAAGEDGNGGGPGKDKNEKDDATGFNLHIPGRGIGAGPMPGGNTAATANSVSTHNSNVGIDTQLSHKLEILIHYLQVYGLVLISSIHINMPDAFKDFSEWVRVFTLNIDQWFSFLPFQQNILFWTVSFFPFLLLFLFWRISRLRGNLNQWIEAYITNWTRTKKQVGIVVGSFVVLGVTCAMLFMVSAARATSTRRIRGEFRWWIGMR